MSHVHTMAVAVKVSKSIVYVRGNLLLVSTFGRVNMTAAKKILCPICYGYMNIQVKSR